MHPRHGRRLPLTPAQGLVVAQASWMVTGGAVALAMLIHLLNGPRAIPFFISEADHQGLQDHVFTVGLTLAGLLQMMYAALSLLVLIFCRNSNVDIVVFNGMFCLRLMCI